MYEFISGTIHSKSPTEVVVNNNGIGYSLKISLNTFQELQDKNEALLYVHLIHRDDVMELYGFAKTTEKKLFQKLISVSGIGPNSGRMILSGFSTDEIVEAIVNENVQLLKSIKGIGIKTAQRLVLELKDKLDDIITTQSGNSATISNNTNVNEALSALVMLGFKKNMAEKVVHNIIKSEGNSIEVEELIKKALKAL